MKLLAAESAKECTNSEFKLFLRWRKLQHQITQCFLQKHDLSLCYKLHLKEVKVKTLLINRGWIEDDFFLSWTKE